MELVKCLYGHPTAGNRWQALMRKTMRDYGFAISDADENLYLLTKEDQCLYALIWVDDIFVTGNCAGSDLWEGWFAHCNKFFKLNLVGPLSHALGLKIEYQRDLGTLKISCPAQAKQIVSRHNMQNCKPAQTPSIPGVYVGPSEDSPKLTENLLPLNGQVTHLARTARPDLSQAASAIARVAANPSECHVPFKQRLIRYVKGTQDVGITMVRQDSTDNPLVVHVDSDFAGDERDRKSTSGVLVSVFGLPVVWSSKKQPIVALSSTEAEYIALCEGGKHAVWVYRLISGLKIPGLSGPDILPIPVYEDNQSAMFMTAKPLNQGRTKHIDVRFHWVRHQVKNGVLKILYKPSTEQLADLLNKPVTVATFLRLMSLGFMGTSIQDQH